jgi:hypothetical protein
MFYSGATIPRRQQFVGEHPMSSTQYNTHQGTVIITKITAVESNGRPISILIDFDGRQAYEQGLDGNPILESAESIPDLLFDLFMAMFGTVERAQNGERQSWAETEASIQRVVENWDHYGE